MGKRNAKDIEHQLRELIDQAGISRYRLAKLSGVSQGVISHFMNGERSLTLTTVAKLAEILEIEFKPVKRKGR